MTSERLPGKVLADICGRPALAHVIERVGRARRLDETIVATTTNAADGPINDLCGSLGIRTFRGDEVDVLGRYQGAAQFCDADVTVRITGDCPMADPSVIDEMIAIFEEGVWDYVSNCNRRTYPDGLDAEVFSRSVLEDAATRAAHPFLREHVTPYIRGSRPEYGSGAYRIHQLVLDADFSHIRWTLDTAEDLTRLRHLIARLPEGYSWLEALSVATLEPDLLGVTTQAQRVS